MALPTCGVVTPPKAFRSCGIKHSLNASPQSGGRFRFRGPDGRQHAQDLVGRNVPDEFASDAVTVGVPQRMGPLVDVLGVAKAWAQRIDQLIGKSSKSRCARRGRRLRPSGVDRVPAREQHATGLLNLSPGFRQRHIMKAA